MKYYGVTIQMKPLQQYFDMVLFIAAERPKGASSNIIRILRKYIKGRRILEFIALRVKARGAGPAASASVFSVCLDFILRVCPSLWDSFL